METCKCLPVPKHFPRKAEWSDATSKKICFKYFFNIHLEESWALHGLRGMSGTSLQYISLIKANTQQLIRPTLLRRQLITLLLLNFSLEITHWPPTQSNHSRSQGYMSSLARDRDRGIYFYPISKSALIFQQKNQGKEFLFYYFS